jgi:hypothetical protein
MPENLREAHDLPVATLRERNNATLGRIYIGRRFKNDTVRSAFPQGKRLEKLFELYTKMMSQTKPVASKKPNRRQTKGAKS